MFKVPIQTEQKEYAIKLEQEISDLRKQQNYQDRDTWFKNNSNTNGFLGEVLFADYFHLPRPILLNEKDNGYDFETNGLKIDVKTNNYTGQNLDLIINPKDLNKESNYFYLIQIINDEAFFWGGITKQEFIEINEPQDYGYGIKHKVNCEKLKDLNGL